MHTKQILPGSTVGIVGGGQLAKMMAFYFHMAGYKVVIYAASENDPALEVARKCVIADWDNKAAWNLFIAQVDLVTYEFENVPLEMMEYIEDVLLVAPSSKVLAISQSRLKEKELFQSLGIPCAAYKFIEVAKDIADLDVEFLSKGVIVKTDGGGYDGKGQIVCSDHSELFIAWNKLGQVPCVIEEKLDFLCEASRQIARNSKGETKISPAVENLHQGGILRQTSWPGCNISHPAEAYMAEAINALSDYLGLVGLLAVEFFTTKDGRVLANETAPRVHNSGHGGIEAAHTCQFEQLVRAVCNLPLGDPSYHTPFVMKNIIGGKPADYMHYLSDPKAHLHWYNKPERYEVVGEEKVRKETKEGHITILDPK